MEEQHNAFQGAASQAPGKTGIRVSMLSPGDKIRIGNNTLTVTKIDEDDEGNTNRARLSTTYEFGEAVMFGDTDYFVDGYEPSNTELSEFDRERLYSEQEQDEAEEKQFDIDSSDDDSIGQTKSVIQLLDECSDEE
jgi:hypothetical protein